MANLRGDAATATALTIQTGGLPGVSVSTTVGTRSGSGPVTCTFGDLAVGETASVRLTTTTAPLGRYTVSAAVITTAFDGFAANDTDAVFVGVATVSGRASPDVPRELTLSSPRPNPVRGATTLRWGLPASSSVDIRVYDLLGHEVGVLAEGEAQEAGWHEARWEASVASGVYVVRVGDEVRTRRMTVIR